LWGLFLSFPLLICFLVSFNFPFLSFVPTKHQTESQRLGEIQYLTEQVLYDLHNDYYRAIGNGLIVKARKIKTEIDLIEAKYCNNGKL